MAKNGKDINASNEPRDKRGRGRPKVPVENLRSVMFQIRLTDHELERLREIAPAAGYETIADYARARLLRYR